MIKGPVRLLGIDPGLRFTGWGIVESDGNRLRHIADGVIATDAQHSVPLRLKALDDALAALIARYAPDEAAVEETYVNRNATATLKLGYARGVALLAPARCGIAVFEYGAKTVKLAVVGTGNADKDPGRADGAPAVAGRGREAGGCGGCAGGRDLSRASSQQPYAVETTGMIGKLRGIIDAIEDQRCLIDVGGVGYLVFASTRTLGALAQSARHRLIIDRDAGA